MKLENKVAVITGGNSGIGLAVAREFSNEGANVVIFGRNRKTLDEAVKSIGKNVLVIQGDVSNLADIDKLYKQTTEKFGKIDILVANAGIAPTMMVEQVTEAHFDQVSDINFKGLYFTVQKAIPHMKDQASVILVSSIANNKGLPGMSVYAATKAAVRSLARTFTSELKARGIRVNVLSPGAIQTPLFGKMGLSPEAVDDFAKNVIAQVPLNRFGKPEEMAKAAIFLASSDSSYVQATELVADGGFTQV